MTTEMVAGHGASQRRRTDEYDRMTEYVVRLVERV